ncbi:hypothetical protein PV733_36650 [Streptomyces europaeiscabiei]|uniref:hypothetical protein n=1 Tax=Streptomyces europaeiscabiei TaxID=146819 RepID=UPI0029BC8E06|nr:hypothetical protein [Streptomyces europaeiscabiei]MDX3714361.1 hypothetical protein [Streptomyces europaeiscabiei]
MTPEQRRRILGDEVIEHINAVVDAAPAPTPDVVEALRRIFTQPLGATPVQAAPASEAA